MSPWLDPPAPSPDPTPLPERVDVLVVGGSLAGLYAAGTLARAGVKVALVEARARFAEADIGRGVGLCQVGTEEPPAQLRAALGEARFVDYLRFSARSAARLLADGVVLQRGGLRACAGQAEADTLDADVEAACAAGLRSGRLEAEELAQRTGTAGLGPGRLCAEDALYDPVATAGALARAAAEAGAGLHLSSPALALEAGAWGERVHLPGGARVEAELLLLTCGWGAGVLDGFLAQSVVPVRHQHLRAPWSGPAQAVSAQRGYLFWSVWGGQLCTGGARWATPHLESWETDDTGTVPAIDSRLRALQGRVFPGAGAPTAAWSAILTHTCDNLPLLGPLPGQPRRVACLGFREHGAALGLEAARCAVDGILEGRSAMEWLAPSRLV